MRKLPLEASKCIAGRSSILRSIPCCVRRVKPLWAYSPSGRWNPGLWMRAWDRGGIISCEYGEPAQSMAFVGSPLVEEEQALALTA